MADWATISSLATAGGTLVLAVATFAAVRSSNRSATIAEIALQEQRRPVLVNSRPSDPAQKIAFGDGHLVRVEGGAGAAEQEDGVVYLTLSLRNVGAGIGVLQGWRAWARATADLSSEHGPVDEMRRQLRDLYVAGGDVGLWQGALRDGRDANHGEIAQAVAERRSIAIELLYSDHLGGQRTITRLGLMPVGDGGWLCGASRHWFLDRDRPN